MPKIIKTVGAGMTREGIVAFDRDEPGDIQAQIEAAVESLNRGSFILTSRRLSELATGMLTAAGLPSDPMKLYLVNSDGALEAVDGSTEHDDPCEAFPLTLAVEARGYAPDSPQGFAADVLTHLLVAKFHLVRGQHDEAMAVAFKLGNLVTEAGMKEIFERDVLTGERVRRGGQRAHVETYGTEDERHARYTAYVETVDKLVAQGAGRVRAYREAAKAHRVSERTVRRAVRASKPTR